MSCLRKAGKIIFKVMYHFCRCLLLSVTLAIEAYFTKIFCIDYAGSALKADMAGQKHVQIIVIVCIVIFAQFMSVLSLLRLFFSNPGFVRDYFEQR